MGAIWSIVSMAGLNPPWTQKIRPSITAQRLRQSNTSVHMVQTSELPWYCCVVFKKKWEIEWNICWELGFVFVCVCTPCVWLHHRIHKHVWFLVFRDFLELRRSCLDIEPVFVVLLLKVEERMSQWCPNFSQPNSFKILQIHPPNKKRTLSAMRRRKVSIL